MERSKVGDPGKLWITAERQLQGKARRGRSWVSDSGNLYASLLLTNLNTETNLTGLPLVVSLALHKALLNTCSDMGETLKIKWPNDLLLNGKKLSGILLEAMPKPDNGIAVIIGCGINCRHFPDNPLYPATSLLHEGYAVPPDALFNELALSMADELEVWDKGLGFSAIRQDWLSRAIGLGKAVTARFTDHEINGTFVDLDEDGYLLLREQDGRLRQISAADIFFGN